MRRWSLGWFPAVVVLLVVGVALAAGEKVGQGQPGNQGPWFVTGAVVLDGGHIVVLGPDGGPVPVSQANCATSLHTNTVVGAAAVNTPAAQLTGRRSVTLCNSLQNVGNPEVKCRVDGVAPVFAAGNPGDVLGLGDCILYTVNSAVVPQCIASGAGRNVTSYECR